MSVNWATHSSQHDANNEPSESPNADEWWGAATGDLGQSPHRTQENGQKPCLEQLTLPTCTNHWNIICFCFIIKCGNASRKSKQFLVFVSCTEHSRQTSDWESAVQIAPNKWTAAPELSGGSFHFGSILVKFVSYKLFKAQIKPSLFAPLRHIYSIEDSYSFGPPLNPLCYQV